MTRQSSAGPAGANAEHTIGIDAPPGTVYRLIADITGWPQFLRSVVHAEVVEDRLVGGERREQLVQLWALAGDRVQSWTSRRVLDPGAGRVRFEQVLPAAPVTSMQGDWRIEPTDAGGTLLVLRHAFRTVRGDREAAEFVADAVDDNSRSGLTALRNHAELGERHDALQFAFRTSVDIAGAAGSADTVYAYLRQAEHWPERLPHVVRAAVTEAGPGMHRLDMDSRTPDGTLHHTRSVRVCFPGRHAIVYKQQRLPVAMRAHTGRWQLAGFHTGRGEPRLRATSWHTITLDPEGVRSTYGDDATLAEARQHIRTSLSTLSDTALSHAKQYAEASRAGA
ncbi:MULTISPECIES: aromatase/cyclase [unclassified Streptomyces]|uniref:aromatase/cyclase n=1 Tax=unclassified Streptomyces TaxID=2593676 RepID=UPI0022B72E92|nr:MULTISPECIES: aromatase/cyclase [unclassified Streptomyces]MCZ7414452.1 aromatase/cyclase [Streptomyces sp. WMMC897]MCZ7431408.1 aromatase/cyclase [Streptomyces sp. WMMC1477]